MGVKEGARFGSSLIAQDLDGDRIPGNFLIHFLSHSASLVSLLYGKSFRKVLEGIFTELWPKFRPRPNDMQRSINFELFYNNTLYYVCCIRLPTYTSIRRFVCETYTYIMYVAWENICSEIV